MKGVKLKLNLETVNCVLLVVILALVIYCVVRQNENFEKPSNETKRLDAQRRRRRRFVCEDLNGIVNMQQKCENSEGCRYVKIAGLGAACLGRSAKVLQDGENIIQFKSKEAASARRGGGWGGKMVWNDETGELVEDSNSSGNPGAAGNAEGDTVASKVDERSQSGFVDPAAMAMGKAW